jgi:retinol dehydrogenase-12
VITGASTGIGREAAVALGRLGAKLVLVGRSRQRHRPVIADLESESIEFDLVEAELSDLSSIATAAGQIEERHPEVTVLVNNAGQGGRRGKTADGFELAFGVNYLSHYLLTRRLLDGFIKNSPARIVNLSSNAHYDIKTFDPTAGLGRTRSFTGLPEYAHSKAAMAAFTLELAHRLVESGVKAVAVHPGLVATDGWRAIPPPFRWFMTRRMLVPAQGALPVLQAVLDPEAKSGSYLTPDGEKVIHPLAADPDTTRRLWELSEGWVARYL